MDTSKNQLYHILKAGTFTYCLICTEDICSKLSRSKEASLVKLHLNGLNHQENVKLFFKLSVADAIDDESGVENFLDIMTRSVLDISNLLHKDTCYICCKNEKQLVCMLCHQEVSDVRFPSTKIKERIISHLLSDRHLKSVKDTNWIYHFNSSKNFFRFHKSLLYCSICKESFQFKESNLLKFADFHLKNHQNDCYAGKEGCEQDTSKAKDESNSSDSAEVVSLGKSTNPSNSIFQSSKSIVNLLSESCFPIQLKKTKSYTCHLCLGDITMGEGKVRHTIDNHFMTRHPNTFQVQGSTLLFKEIICFNERFIDPKVTLRKFPGIAVLSDCVPVFGDNWKYIQIFDKLSFCKLCSEMVTYDSDSNNLLRNFSTHFSSDDHKKVLKRKGDTGYDRAYKQKVTKRLQPSPKTDKESLSKKRKVVKKKIPKCK